MKISCWEATPACSERAHLMVTEERLPQNPVYGRPKQEIINE
ncbi:hypothetical protein [Nonomuraea sp. NPDC049784]